MSKVFTPNELKTIEVDIENKIFKINGEEFGKNCTGFRIECSGYNDFHIRAEMDTTVHYSSYGQDLKKVDDEEYECNTPWFSECK